MRKVSIGKPYTPGIQKFTPEARFDLIGNECTLDLFWDHLTPDDVANVSIRKATLGLWYSDNNDVFFLYRFGDDSWADTVFSIMQLPPKQRIRPPFSKTNHGHLDLNVALVDADTGLVRAKRNLPLPVSFSKKMCSSVGRQYTRRYQFDWREEDFTARVHEVYRMYPSSESLLHAPGCIVCRTE